MRDLEASVDRIVSETGFSGVVRVDRDDEVLLATAYGFAHRGFGVANTVDTRFAIASGTKGFTALTVMSLIEEGRLALTTTARSVLGEDLPLIDDAVTIEQLLAHRSGIGDYFDEEIDRPIADHVLDVPVHELATIEDYVRVLDGYPMKFPPGERFSYCNGGYVVLALIAERTVGTSFHDLVMQRVCEPAGAADTSFLRSDELPGRTALGYLDADGDRTNVLHLPVGEQATAGSSRPRPTSSRSGTRCSRDGSSRRTGSPRWCGPTATSRRRRLATAWGSGSTRRATWSSSTATTRACRSRPTTTRTRVSSTTVLSNTSEGAWPIAEHLDQLFAP